MYTHTFNSSSSNDDSTVVLATVLADTTGGGFPYGNQVASFAGVCPIVFPDTSEHTYLDNKQGFNPHALPLLALRLLATTREQPLPPLSQPPVTPPVALSMSVTYPHPHL